MQTRYRCIIVNVVLSVGIMCAQAAEKQTEQLSVCEVIAHRIEYNRKMVVVRGEVKAGGHGSWLLASSDCQYKLITRGVEWEKLIFLDYPDNESENETGHASFRVDLQAIQKAHEAVGRAGYNPETDRLIKTYIGLFVTYPDLDKRVNPGIPGALKLGFGPVGLEAPAQLLIKSVRDVVVVHSAVR